MGETQMKRNPNTAVDIVRLFSNWLLVSGVEYIDRKTGELKQVISNKEVILCASGLLTPKILLLSGIGPKIELEALGIEPKRNLAGVGKNLQAPILVPVACAVKSNNYFYGMYPTNKKEFANRDWFMDHSGPHKSMGLDIAALLRTKSGVIHFFRLSIY